MITLLIAVGVAGFVFFFVRWIQLQLGYRSMSELERRYAEIDATTESKLKDKDNNTISAKRARLLARWGMKDSVFPVIAVLAFAYITLAAVMVALGINMMLSALLPLPIGLIGAVFVSRVVANRRQKRFNQQLVDLLDLLTGQLRSGVGMDRALVNVLPSLQEPMFSEIDAALEAVAAGGDLIPALGDIRNRYPSRSLDLFLSLLEIDRSEGSSITEALEQAGDIMKNSFALQSEGRAELSSSKAEFYGVTGIVVLLSGNSILNSTSPDGYNPWLSLTGAVILTLLVANVAFGIFRFTRVMRSLEKEAGQ